MRLRKVNETKLSGAAELRTQNCERSRAAFTLPEVLVAVLLLGLAGSAFFVGMGQGFTFTQENELNMRAEQIVAERMETIRLYNWMQVTNITTNGVYVPKSFTAYFYPNGGTNGTGVAYTGAVTIGSAGLTEAYNTDIRQVTVTVNWYSGSNWSTGKIKHQLSATTFVTHYGMQNYVYETK
jgi:prepilin-type N-terminal cleavage/methylation domain-containing protein